LEDCGSPARGVSRPEHTSKPWPVDAGFRLTSQLACVEPTCSGTHAGNASCSDADQACETAVVNVSVLNREMFSEAEAARLLELPQSTLHYWLEGGERRGRLYKPIVRIEPQGTRSVTWAEFIESGLLRQYRREQRVPMAELRAFIDVLRERTGIPYPLAHMRPFVADRQLVMEAQDIAGLEAEFCLVAEVRGQLILTPPSEEFVHRVTWAEQLPVAWRPHSDPRSPVRIDPEVRFGRPMVNGISTEVLWEHLEEGEGFEEVADAFELDVADVSWASSYEMSRRAA
jgi:uncharacterized protein (DUF433 family)